MRRLWRFAAAMAALGAILALAEPIAVHAKGALGPPLMARAWRAAQFGRDGRPWPWADFQAAGEVALPTLHARHVLANVASGEALTWGPAWVRKTPPYVVAAHRNTHFARLDALHILDPVTLTLTDGRREAFVVSAKWRQAHAQLALTSEDEDTAYLTTCQEPAAGEDARFVVQLARVRKVVP